VENILKYGVQSTIIVSGVLRKSSLTSWYNWNC